MSITCRDTYQLLVMMDRRYLHVMTNPQPGHELHYPSHICFSSEEVKPVQVIQHSTTLVRFFGHARGEHLPRHVDSVQHVHYDELVR